MKIINEPKSVELDNTYSKSSNSDSLIPDDFYESKSASIFDDDFQGIEWSVKKHRPDIHNPLDTVVGVVISDLPGNIFNDDNS